MRSVEFNELIKLEERLDRCLKEWPELKKEAILSMGQAALDIVQAKAAASGLARGGGRVPGWQRYYPGSGGGYVAVRPAGGRDGGGVGPESAGAVTNYVEHGHAIRRPSAVAKDGYRYRPRIRVPAVRGFHFYATAGQPTTVAALEAGERLCRQGAQMIGG